MTVATMQTRCPFCGAGAGQLRLGHRRPEIGPLSIHVAVECEACREAFAILWRGRHADRPLLAYAFRTGLSVSALEQLVRWRDTALAIYQERP